MWMIKGEGESEQVNWRMTEAESNGRCVFFFILWDVVRVKVLSCLRKMGGKEEPLKGTMSNNRHSSLLKIVKRKKKTQKRIRAQPSH